MTSNQFGLTEPIHRCTYRVLYGDTDAGQVVYYGNYLRYFERGRTEFMRDLATTYKDLEDRGFILPAVECYLRYKASAFYDDLLIIETSMPEFNKVSCRFAYRILREQDGRLLVKGYSRHAVVNRNGKLTRLPDDIMQILNRLTNHGVTTGR